MAIEILKIRRHTTGKVTYENYANNQERPMAGNGRGEGIVLPAHFNAVSEGRVFVAQIGSATTPVSFAKTAYDADQPQFVVDVPAGTTIVPITLSVVLEDQAGTDNEVIWSTSDVLIGAGTSTAVTPVNARLAANGNNPTTACSVYSLYTGNGTAPSGGYEFARFTDPFAQAATSTDSKRMFWRASEQGWSPQIEGVGALVCHIDGTTTAPAGYLIAVWWEFDT